VSECPPLHDFLPSSLWFPMCYLFKSSGILTCGDIKILLKFHFRILRILNFRQICSREWKGPWRNYTILPNFLMVLTGTNTTYQREEGVWVVPLACLGPWNEPSRGNPRFPISSRIEDMMTQVTFSNPSFSGPVRRPVRVYDIPSEQALKVRADSKKKPRFSP